LSIEAMQWAFNQDIKPSSVKFVLVSLGDNAQADGLAWPSIAALCQKTGQDRKTVISALDRLEAMGYLADSGKRTGNTGQIKVYKFNFARANNTESGTVPEAEQYRISHQTVPNFPSNSTVFPAKSTENGTRNPQEPKGTVKEPKTKRGDAASDFSPLDFLLANGVALQTAKDWLKLRRTKKADPTQTAIDGVIREARNAGLTLEAALQVCCERGWAGFMAKWIDASSTRETAAKPSRHSGFDKTNYNEGVSADGRID
jgi:hypothetical protein